MKRGILGKPLVAAAMACLLPACSGAPGEADVRAAVEANLAQANDDMVQMAGSRIAANIDPFALKAFELLGCEEAGKESYSCDVKMSIDTPLVTLNDQMQTLRVRETSDGWAVIEGMQ